MWGVYIKVYSQATVIQTKADQLLVDTILQTGITFCF